VIGDWVKGWEIQVQPVAVQLKPKRMQEEDVGTKSLYIPPNRPLSQNRVCSASECVILIEIIETPCDSTSI
jgi:hypothetical protein